MVKDAVIDDAVIDDAVIDDAVIDDAVVDDAVVDDAVGSAHGPSGHRLMQAREVAFELRHHSLVALPAVQTDELGFHAERLLLHRLRPLTVEGVERVARLPLSFGHPNVTLNADLRSSHRALLSTSGRTVPSPDAWKRRKVDRVTEIM
jgi:hypothetical protein